MFGHLMHLWCTAVQCKNYKFSYFVNNKIISICLCASDAAKPFETLKKKIKNDLANIQSP